MHQAPPTNKVKVAPLRLALSGGGLRATLFHLGVVRALLEAGRLADVTHITAVSGASILAAHLALNWELYKDPEQFEKAANRLLAFIEIDIRNHILRALPILRFKRFFFRTEQNATHELERYYRDFFQQRDKDGRTYDPYLRDLAGFERPSIALLGTNVGRARLCWFTSGGFLVLPTSRGGMSEMVGGGTIHVAEAVAASSAFPLLFPPKKFDRDELKYEDQSKYQFVTDAGVYDNLGLSSYLKDPLTGVSGIFADSGGSVIVSDATATIDWDSAQYPGLLQNLSRSIDIIHQRSSDLLRQKANLFRRDSASGNEEPKRQSSPPGQQPDYILVDIEEDKLTTAPCLVDSFQRHLSYLRTDLDAFSACESHYLVQHGYCVAWHVLKENSLLEAGSESAFDKWRHRWPSELAAKLDSKMANDELRKGALRKFKIFRIADANSWLMLGTLVLTIFLIIGAIFVAFQSLPQKWTIRRQLHHNEAEAAALIRHYHDNPVPSGAPPVPLNATELDNLPEYRHVEILSVVKVFDLRDWKDVKIGPGTPKVEELARMQTNYLIRRRPEKGKIIFEFKTSGDEVRPWVGPPYKGVVYRLPDQKKDAHTDYPQRWQIAIPIGSEPPFREFSLTVGGTYVNAFQTGHLDAAFKAYTDSELAAVIILFPKSKRATNFQFFWKADDSQPRQNFTKRPFAVEAENSLYFEIESPRHPRTYGVFWEWAK